MPVGKGKQAAALFLVRLQPVSKDGGVINKDVHFWPIWDHSNRKSLLWNLLWFGQESSRSLLWSQALPSQSCVLTCPFKGVRLALQSEGFPCQMLLPAAFIFTGDTLSLILLYLYIRIFSPDDSTEIAAIPRPFSCLTVLFFPISTFHFHPVETHDCICEVMFNECLSYAQT